MPMRRRNFCDDVAIAADYLLVTTSLLAYVRPGFEPECAQEIEAQAAQSGIAGYARTQRDSGMVEFVLASHEHAGGPNDALGPLLDVRTSIFSRQRLASFAQFRQLPRGDRLTPIVAALKERAEAFCDVWVEAPETDAGKELARMCKSLNNALIAALKRERLIDARASRRLHLFAANEEEFFVAVADLATASPWPGGIPRLKFPHEAPSRSTLKLDEAFVVLLDEVERTQWLKPGMSAVDLGAAPGGWTYQFVRRGMKVTAIDNGPMAPALLASGLVNHLREDGFRYRPKTPVDWLVCDMVEQPLRVAERMATWLAEGWCRRTIFNLKLPMKKRYTEVQRCFDAMRAAMPGQDLELRGKQLYHDREEITVFAQRRGRDSSR
jgi:23S rRNA (cytidine2498-2'-O)-methyltransferase